MLCDPKTLSESGNDQAPCQSANQARTELLPSCLQKRSTKITQSKKFMLKIVGVTGNNSVIVDVHYIAAVMRDDS